MDKRMVIAQVLYLMAVHDKTQPMCLLSPKRKQELAERLAMYQTLLSWMTSDLPLAVEQTQCLIGYVERHREIFPRIASSVKHELLAYNDTIACQSVFKDEWNLLTAKMNELLCAVAQWLSRPTAIHNKRWIISFMAFHNLPRAFMNDDYQGLWNNMISPMRTIDALQAASYDTL